MAESRPFPVVLRWLLLVPVGLLLVSYGLPKELALPAWLLACGSELLFVPIAIFYLVRGGYRTLGNVAMTLVAAIPVGIIVLIVLTLMFGHFHI